MTQQLAEWNVPNRILFGRGASDEVGSYIDRFDAERALVVTDEGVREAGVLEPVLESIEEAGKEYAIFDGVQPDPTDTVVHEAADAYDDADANLILGIGGGSSLDTAKAASIIAANDGHILDYEGSGNVPESPPPSIYIPTTSGTGSEVGHWCIVKDSETDVKEEIGDVKLLADLALIDPDLTASAPPPVKAATGMDVLTHAIEAYVSIKAQSQTSAIALDSVEKVGEFLPRAVEYRDGDPAALTAMARASMQAGMAFNGAGLGAVHALSHQVGGQFGVPHGLVNAIILPYVMEYNLSQVPEKFCTIAERLGEPIDRNRRTQLEAYKAVRVVRELGDSVRIPRTLDETAAEREAIPALAAQALEDGSLTGNPRLTDVDDMEHILERAFDGVFEYESRL
ncbi:alcohol dehydrogenase [Haladaptatus sp. R4]|uniref:iron-containing alcohol dehydrogenase family protein n=1 Tax=Haladaptatus sp. R4 TaxID=1679489 RepID=UPI0007B4D808|nr:iron-containing alcohol dehydrogenase [Haladaptatus sp. R4]KZN23225.1 alcohol dehydrogenase [Haladaptatus sp. R4]